MYFSAAHLRHASVTYIFFNSKYSYSMMPKLDRMNVYCLYPCEGIVKKSELWQHSDPVWPKEGDNLKFEPCIIIVCYQSARTNIKKKLSFRPNWSLKWTNPRLSVSWDSLKHQIFPSGPSGFSTAPIGPWTRVHLVSPYGGPCGLDFWVLYIWILLIFEFFHLDPQDFLPYPGVK